MCISFEEVMNWVWNVILQITTDIHIARIMLGCDRNLVPMPHLNQQGTAERLSSFVTQTGRTLSYSSYWTIPPASECHVSPLSVPKHRHMTFRRRGIAQKKELNIQNKAKVWYHEGLTFLVATMINQCIQTHFKIHASAWRNVFRLTLCNYIKILLS
jgi:hypothetical protein